MTHCLLKIFRKETYQEKKMLFRSAIILVLIVCSLAREIPDNGENEKENGKNQEKDDIFSVINGKSSKLKFLPYAAFGKNRTRAMNDVFASMVELDAAFLTSGSADRKHFNRMKDVLTENRHKIKDFIKLNARAVSDFFNNYLRGVNEKLCNVFHFNCGKQDNSNFEKNQIKK